MSISNLFTLHHKEWQNLRVNSITADSIQLVDSSGGAGPNNQLFTMPNYSVLPAVQDQGSLVSVAGDVHYSDGVSWIQLNGGGGGLIETSGPWNMTVNSADGTNITGGVATISDNYYTKIGSMIVARATITGLSTNAGVQAEIVFNVAPTVDNFIVGTALGTCEWYNATPLSETGSVVSTGVQAGRMRFTPLITGAFTAYVCVSYTIAS